MAKSDLNKCPCCDAEYVTLKTEYGIVHIIVDPEYKQGEIEIRDDQNNRLGSININYE